VLKRKKLLLQKLQLKKHQKLKLQPERLLLKLLLLLLKKLLHRKKKRKKKITDNNRYKLILKTPGCNVRGFCLFYLSSFELFWFFLGDFLPLARMFRRASVSDSSAGLTTGNGQSKDCHI